MFNKTNKINKPVLKKTILITLILIVFNIIIILFNLPSSAIAYIVKKYSHNKINLINANGNIWQGSANIALNNRGVPYIIPNPINWQLDVEWLKLGQAKFFIHHSFIQPHFKYFIFKRQNSAFKINFPLAYLQNTHPVLSSIGIQGKVDVLMPKMEWSKHENFSQIIEVKLKDVFSNQIPQIILGTYLVKIYPTSTLDFNIQTIENGGINITGKGSLKPLHTNLFVRAQPEYSKQLMPLLSMLGNVIDNEVEIKL